MKTPLAICAIVMSAACVIPACAQPDGIPSLFTTAGPVTPDTRLDFPASELLRISHVLQTNPDALESNLVRLDLFDRTFTIQKTYVNYFADSGGDFFWHGKIVETGDRVFFGVYDNSVQTAELNINLTRYIVDAIDDDSIVIYVLDPAKAPVMSSDDVVDYAGGTGYGDGEHVLRNPSGHVQGYMKLFPDSYRETAKDWATGSDPEAAASMADKLDSLVSAGTIDSGAIEPRRTGPDLPDWWKRGTAWWAEGLVSDREHLDATGYLIQEGVIVLAAADTYQDAGTAVSDGETRAASSTNVIYLAADSWSPACRPDCLVPTNLHVATGEPVTFINNDRIPHIFAGGHSSIYDGEFHSGILQPNQTYTVSFDRPGIYPYFTTPSSWAEGTITIGSPPANLPPTVDAGEDRTVYEGDYVTVSGYGTDPEGEPLRYTLEQISGPSVFLAGSARPGGLVASQSSVFTAPEVSSDTVLTFRLTVKDSILQTASDTVSITVRDAEPG